MTNSNFEHWLDRGNLPKYNEDLHDLISALSGVSSGAFRAEAVGGGERDLQGPSADHFVFAASDAMIFIQLAKERYLLDRLV